MRLGIRESQKRASFHAKKSFPDISHPLDRRKKLKMAVIAVGSRPETPDITKFFELSAVDKRFAGERYGETGGEREGGFRILGIHIYGEG